MLIRFYELNRAFYVQFMRLNSKIQKKRLKTEFYQIIENSILPTTGGKVKNAQNHRRIDARGEAESSKPVMYGILYCLVRWVHYFILP